MGTNYYLHRNVCRCCNRGDEPLHIGKSSWGWCFALNTHPDEGILSLDDWQREWGRPKTLIKDEYGEPLDSFRMLKVITERSSNANRSDPPLGYPSWDSFLRANYAELGPNRLLRHRVDGKHCIAHGEGTYDFMRGEFS